jgi:ubiquitin carboxyl-terminal hydrolase 9/24
MKPVFNILVKTNINSLTNYLLEYFEPLKQVEKIPLPNKNAKKYVGLKNLGCICYMNAMLQQLFMTKDFVIELSKSKGK